jgi:hypothetical protein
LAVAATAGQNDFLFLAEVYQRSLDVTRLDVRHDVTNRAGNGARRSSKQDSKGAIGNERATTVP